MKGFVHCIVADNLGAHSIAGFVENFSGKYVCRFCTAENEDSHIAEFLRITTVQLQAQFLTSLDKHHSKLIEIIRNKGGVVREKTRNIMKVLDQVRTCSIHQN